MKTNKNTKLSFDEWVDQFKPIQNEFDSNASFNGLMFETFGIENEFVLKIGLKEIGRIWTLVDGDGGKMFIVEGYAFVNRIGYFVTERSIESKTTFNITLN